MIGKSSLINDVHVVVSLMKGSYVLSLFGPGVLEINLSLDKSLRQFPDTAS